MPAVTNKPGVQISRSTPSTGNRPNAFIEDPATAEGLPAIRQLISEGVNVIVHVTQQLENQRVKNFNQPFDKSRTVLGFAASVTRVTSRRAHNWPRSA
ncbi:MAG: hypothetical protein ACLP9L_42600 [Thermoguttaceae bacterium]